MPKLSSIHDQVIMLTFFDVIVSVHFPQQCFLTASQIRRQMNVSSSRSINFFICYCNKLLRSNKERCVQHQKAVDSIAYLAAQGGGSLYPDAPQQF